MALFFLVYTPAGRKEEEEGVSLPSSAGFKIWEKLALTKAQASVYKREKLDPAEWKIQGVRYHWLFRSTLRDKYISLQKEMCKNSQLLAPCGKLNPGPACLLVTHKKLDVSMLKAPPLTAGEAL